jgi:phage gp36-like protein
MSTVTYATKTQLQQELGTKSTLLLAGLSDDQIAAIIEKQSRVIDDYLRSVITVPFDNVSATDSTLPDVINEICLSLVKYKIWTQRASGDCPEHVRKDFEEAKKTLEKIQQGKLKIPPYEDFADEEDDISDAGLVGGATAKLRWVAQPRRITGPYVTGDEIGRIE